MKKIWNYNKKFLEENIVKLIKEIFFINDTNTIKLQNITMNLKHIFKLNNIILLKNKKHRNINTYIKDVYGGFKKFIKIKGVKYYNYDNKTDIITLL